MLLLAISAAAAAAKEAAGRLEQVRAEIVFALLARLMGRQRLVAQVLRLLPIERKLGHRKAKPLPEHFVAPLNAGAALEPLEQIAVEVRDCRLAQHNDNEPMTVVVSERLEMGGTEFVLHPFAVGCV